MRTSFFRCSGPAFAVAALAAAPGTAVAQFGVPVQTQIRQVLVGQLDVSATDVVVAPGDQLAAVVNGIVAGVYTFTPTQAVPDEYALTIFGDLPGTNVVEGPQLGQIVTFEFFDASRSLFRTDLASLNAAGETANFLYGGTEVFDPFDELGLDLPGVPDAPTVPTTNVTIALGQTVSGQPDEPDETPTDPTPGTPSTPGTPTTPSQPATPEPTLPNPAADIDSNGRIDSTDAAIVLRAVLGGSVAAGAVSVSALDVNGDGVVSVSDAIEVLRLRRGG